MRVLVLSWDARARDGGLAEQAATLAGALAAEGHDVRLVTRLGEDGEAPRLPGVEVHAAADAPPIVPPGLDQPVLPAFAFAARALSVAVRRLEERPVDLVHAEGWQTGPVVDGLRTSHGPPVLAVLDARDVGPAGQVGGEAGDAAAGTGRQLATDATVVACRSRADRAALATAGIAATLLPPVAPGTVGSGRRPGPPPPSGPLHLVAPPAADHRRLAAAVRGALHHKRRVTRSWGRRPYAVAVLDPHDLSTALRAMALGVPLLAADGPVGELASDTGAGVVVEPVPDAVASAVQQLVDRPDRAAALGTAGLAAVAERTPGAATRAWSGLVEQVVMGSGGPGHLHAAD